MGRISKGENKPPKEPRLVDHISDSSDEEIDEDIAFNSDDERKYGDLFQKKPKTKPKKEKSEGDSSDDDDDSSQSSDENDSDGFASDDSDDEGDGGEFMLSLLDNLDKKESDQKQEKQDLQKQMAHSTLIQDSSSGVSTSKLTLDQLMGDIADTKGFSHVQKAMNGISDEKRIQTTSAPVAKIISDRAERKVNYQEQSKEASQWTSSVKKNREAETLDFRPKDRIRMSKAELVSKFEPSTDFEREIAAALEEAGATEEKDIIQREEEELFASDGEYDDDLGGNKLSVDELKKRRGELAKMRALMFYEEQKRYHINKIKSKKYRKIRKKQKLRRDNEEETAAAEEDDILARELQEKAEIERMKERISLKHKNTSKWAKRVLRRGGNVDLDTRRALSEQLRVGDDLKKKMLGEMEEDDDDENDADLLQQARDVLSGIETESNGANENQNGIFQMAFMKKGMELQRERAKEEARSLLKELEGNESNSENDDKCEIKTKKRKKKKVSSDAEMKQVMNEGKLVASALEFGKSNSIKVAGAINIDGSSEKPLESMNEQNVSGKIVLSNVGAMKAGIKANDEGQISSNKTSAAGEGRKEEATSNPWMSKVNTGKSKNKSIPGVSRDGVVNIRGVEGILSKEKTGEKELPALKLRDSSEDKTEKIADLSQEELVRRAFAAPDESLIEEEFEQEKV